MAEDDTLTQLIGTRTSSADVVVERGPIAAFALAVCDQNPIYRDPRASEAAGFDAIPAPPTFPFADGDVGPVRRACNPDDQPVGGGNG